VRLRTTAGQLQARESDGEGEKRWARTLTATRRSWSACSTVGSGGVASGRSMAAMAAAEGHGLSGCNETVLNAPKNEFWVQWSGSGEFVAKNSDATSFSELVR
jgi:hypothetical protein